MEHQSELKTDAIATDRWLGAASIALACGVLFVHTPALIYSISPESFPYSLASTLAPVSVALIILMTVVALPLLLRWRAIVRGWAVVWFSLAAVIWVSASFLVLKTGPLDGRLTEILVPASFASLSGWVLTSTAIVFTAIGLRATRAAAIAAVILNLALLGTTVSRLAGDFRTKPRIAADKVDALSRFSTSRNVLVIILDTFQSDVFQEIFKRNPRYGTEFSGFSFFPDALGAASSTYVAMPTIHSGKVYDGLRTLTDVYQDDVRRGSFFRALAKHGFETSMLDTVGEPEGVPNLTTPAVMGTNSWIVVLEAYVRLLDFSLFRIMPAPLKPAVFNGGAWWLQQWVSRGAKNGHFQQLLSLDLIGKRLHTSKRPTVKLIHMYTSHPPIKLDAACRPLVKPEAVTRESMLSQCNCAIVVVTGLLKRLKAAGVYDNSEIFIIGDHGFGFPSAYIPAGEYPEGGDWRSMVGLANPLVLWKPVGSHGKLATSDQTIQLGDVPATICERTQACPELPGVPLNRAGGSRKRIYVHYAWSSELWQAARIPGMQWFSVDGPLWLIRSWSRIRAPRLAAGSRIDFGKSPESVVYLDWGWSGHEPTGFWSISERPSLSFSMENSSSGAPVRLVARVYPYLRARNPKMTVGVIANGRRIANWHFELTHPITDMEAILPPGVSSEDGSVKLEFDIQNPVSPVSTGESGDTRRLGIVMNSLAAR